jgi:hypothetical protein
MAGTVIEVAGVADRIGLLPAHAKGAGPASRGHGPRAGFCRTLAPQARTEG